ncbi:hypothetical protein ACFWF7_09055 [Nocardia sp. NPDC060256]|uniref:hypothetical protein n=1 Tax=unclassified Nocardia TaxID=2637762 RepID=UPI0036461B99
MGVLEGAEREISTASSAPVGSGVAGNPSATVGAGSEADAAADEWDAPDLDVVVAGRDVVELDAAE